MKRIIWGIMLALILISFLGCKNKISLGDEPRIVNIREAIEKKKNSFLSEIINGEIEYVLLESNKEILLRDAVRFYANDSLIIAFAKQQVFVFDRKTGEFLREIGHYGRDPLGYQKTIHSYPYDEKNNLIYLNSWDPQVYFRYNSSGELVDEISAYSNSKESDIQNSDFGEIVTSIAPLNDTCFVGYVWNINGKQKTKLIVFNENRNRIKTYPQYKTFELDPLKDGLTIYSWDGWFYEFNRGLYFFERFSDTIFHVSPEKLDPKYVLLNGDFGSPYEKLFTKEYNYDDYYFLNSVFESARFLLFQFDFKKTNYYGWYEKNGGVVKVSDNQNGVEDDVDGFIPFSFCSVNNKGELIGFQEAYEIEAWFKDNPEKAASLPLRLQKFRNIDENDNPIVMIAKLKN